MIFEPEKAEWPPREAVPPAAQPAFCRTERKQWPPREESRLFRQKGPIGACLEDGDAARYVSSYSNLWGYSQKDFPHGEFSLLSRTI